MLSRRTQLVGGFHQVASVLAPLLDRMKMRLLTGRLHGLRHTVLALGLSSVTSVDSRMHLWGSIISELDDIVVLELA